MMVLPRVVLHVAVDAKDLALLGLGENPLATPSSADSYRNHDLLLFGIGVMEYEARRMSFSTPPA
jgi:hypothetical protein